MAAGDAAAETDQQARSGRGSGDVPVLGLRFPAEGGSEIGGRMDLKAKPLPAVQPLYEERKGPMGRETRAHDGGGIGLEHGAERSPVEGASDDDGLGLRTIDEFPTLADRAVRRQRPAEGGLKSRPPQTRS